MIRSRNSSTSFTSFFTTSITCLRLLRMKTVALLSAGNNLIFSQVVDSSCSLFLPLRFFPVGLLLTWCLVSSSQVTAVLFPLQFAHLTYLWVCKSKRANTSIVLDMDVLGCVYCVRLYIHDYSHVYVDTVYSPLLCNFVTYLSAHLIRIIRKSLLIQTEAAAPIIRYH